MGRQTIGAKDIDEGLLALGQGRPVKLEDVWRSPIFGGACYLRIYRRVEHLCALGKIAVERDGRFVLYKTRSDGE